MQYLDIFHIGSDDSLKRNGKYSKAFMDHIEKSLILTEYLKTGSHTCILEFARVNGIIQL